jgi:GTP1/Obg family GTP-binding protein
MSEFEKVIARTLRRLREIEAEYRELAEALLESDSRRSAHLKDADRAAQAVKEVSEMYRRVMSS